MKMYLSCSCYIQKINHFTACNNELLYKGPLHNQRENQVIEPLGGKPRADFDQLGPRSKGNSFFVYHLCSSPPQSRLILSRHVGQYVEAQYSKLGSKTKLLVWKTEKKKKNYLQVVVEWCGKAVCVGRTCRVALLSPFQKSFLNSDFIDAQLRRRRTSCWSSTRSHPIILSRLTSPLSHLWNFTMTDQIVRRDVCKVRKQLLCTTARLFVNCSGALSSETVFLSLCKFLLERSNTFAIWTYVSKSNNCMCASSACFDDQTTAKSHWVR